MSNLIESRGYIDRTININGVGTLAQGSTDPDGYGCERMHDEAVLEEMKIIEIFKTPVAKFILNEDVDALTKFSRKWVDNHPSVSLSNKGGYQSPNLDLNIPELQSLREQTTRCFNELKASFFYTAPLTIDNMWLNINYPHSYNQIHNHPRCCFAGSFYLSVPENSGDIIFHSEKDVTNYMLPKWTTKYGEYNSITWTLPVERNAFYVFPGWLKHSVEANQSKEDRISISINVTEEA